jgi:acid phosphatase
MGKMRPSHQKLLRVLPVLAALAAEAGCGGGTHTIPPPPGIPVVAHVFLLVDENHSYGDVIGNPVMPYTNSLAHQNSLATAYYANAHPSLPNYFMLTTGMLVADSDQFAGPYTGDNLARALTQAGKSWKMYAEALPHTGYVGPTVVPYDKNHNPFAYLSDTMTASAQAANIVPFTELQTDLASGTLPDFAMIAPSLENDAHDCPNEAPQCTDAQKLGNADAWIQAKLGPLITSPAFNNSVLILTWDESEMSDTANGGGHVAMILVGSPIKRNYQSTTFYQHQSTLRLVMELLGVADFPGAAAAAPEMTEFLAQ